jgi:hypothetical protein
MNSDEFNPNMTQRIKSAVKSKIIPNWKSRLRDYSTIALGLVTTLSTAMLAAWAVMPTEWKEALPQNIMLYFGGAYLVIGAWGGIGKFLIQGESKVPQEQPGDA